MEIISLCLVAYYFIGHAGYRFSGIAGSRDIWFQMASYKTWNKTGKDQQKCGSKNCSGPD